ncbi:MAG: aminotransferase class V-fold PLP-dependent enzyme [Alphaproteobacteria bacterium]|nr:aminotransferase class V-fold PLP-dependent enzyme [Alphaproteobacteria bacterium]
MVAYSSIEAARADFPGTESLTYMNVSARGLMPQRARDDIDRMLDNRQSGDNDKAAMFELIEHARDSYARLINASADEIAFVKNVSEGLNAIIAAFPWKSGDNVVLCQDLEHPNNVYPWRNLAKRFGVEIRTVSPRDGAIPTDEIIDQIDQNTRMVTASSVTFAPGFRTDMAPIGTICREKDILFLVDGVQSVGILHTDVEALGIDAMSVSTQKGLLGLYGMGFLYCRADWAERLSPAYLARFGVDLGESGAHEASLGDGDYRLMPAARRFDLGNYNYVGVAAADASMGIMHELGTEAIEEYTVGLAHDFARGMLDLGLPVCGGEPGPHLGSIIPVGSIGEGQHDTTDDPTMSSLHDHLEENGVQLSIRRGILRFSLHFYNNSDDIDRVLDLTRTWRGHNRAAVG